MGFARSFHRKPLRIFLVLLLAVGLLYSALQLNRRRDVVSEVAPVADTHEITQDEHGWKGDGAPNEDKQDEVVAEDGKPSLCTQYPDTGKIAVSIKTGATEALAKLPATLETSLSCVRDIMIFSDLEQTINDIRIHDVLARLSENTTKQNPDFDVYWTQKDLQKQGHESRIKELANEPAPLGHWRTFGHTAPWALDKYKFMPMIEAAYEMQPDRDWYIFLEADTYLSWANLNRWLATMNPNELLYLGRSIQKSDERYPKFFAHGGSGFMISGALAKKMCVENAGMTARIEHRMRDWWAGDFMVADALYDELSIQVDTIFPMFNDLPLTEIGFKAENWCLPVITLHHMQAADFRAMHQLEESLGFSRLLMRDIYGAAFPDGLPFYREDWDNISDDQRSKIRLSVLTVDPESNETSRDPNQNFATCKRACTQDERCFQFFHRRTSLYNPRRGTIEQHQCYISNSFRLGHIKEKQGFGTNGGEPGTARSWTSGWLSDRVEQWVQNHQTCTSDFDWTTNSALSKMKIGGR